MFSGGIWRESACWYLPTPVVPAGFVFRASYLDGWLMTLRATLCLPPCGFRLLVLIFPASLCHHIHDT